MSPHTVHLLAQFIRYQRGWLTSVEKWAGKQPPSPTVLELCSATGLMREVLMSYEKAISQIEPPELRDEGLVDHMPEFSGHSVRKRP